MAVLFFLLASFLISCDNYINNKNAQNVDYKVGILGAPSSPDIKWNDRNMKLMKEVRI